MPDTKWTSTQLVVTLLPQYYSLIIYIMEEIFYLLHFQIKQGWMNCLFEVRDNTEKIILTDHRNNMKKQIKL